MKDYMVYKIHANWIINLCLCIVTPYSVQQRNNKIIIQISHCMEKKQHRCIFNDGARLKIYFI